MAFAGFNVTLVSEKTPSGTISCQKQLDAEQIRIYNILAASPMKDVVVTLEDGTSTSADLEVVGVDIDRALKREAFIKLCLTFRHSNASNHYFATLCQDKSSKGVALILPISENRITIALSHNIMNYSTEEQRMGSTGQTS